MRLLRRTVCLVASFVFSHGAFGAALLVQNVTVHTMTDAGTLQRVDILVEDGRIAAMAPDLSSEGVATVIDGQSLIATPGLMTAYSQLGLDEIDLEVTTVDSKVDVLGFGPSLDVSYAFNPHSSVIEVNLVEGVTHGIIAPRLVAIILHLQVNQI